MRLLVHFHVYYHDQVDYFIEKMSNINGCDWDLYVTMNGLVQETVDKLTALKPDARFIEMENVGYDVWPFIKVMKSVNLDDYDLVMKLHTKSKTYISIHRIQLNGFDWRNAMVNSLLRTEKQFRLVLDIFRKKPNVGLVCSDILLLETAPWNLEDGILLDKELKRIGMHVTDRRFCAGTIFMARASIFRFLYDENINKNMFPVEMKSHSEGSMAHVYERILSLSANASGYKVFGVSSDRMISIYLFLNNMVTILFKNILSINREGPDRTKVLRFLGIKFDLK